MKSVVKMRTPLVLAHEVFELLDSIDATDEDKITAVEITKNILNSRSIDMKEVTLSADASEATNPFHNT